VTLRDANGNLIQSYTFSSSGFQFAPVPLQPGTYEVTIEITQGEGGASASAILAP